MVGSKKEVASIFGVLLLAAGLAAVVPVTKHDFYIIGLLTSVCIWVVYVVCWDILAGYTGMLNFGQLLFAGVAGYTVALIELNTNLGTLQPPWLECALARVQGYW